MPEYAIYHPVTGIIVRSGIDPHPEIYLPDYPGNELALIDGASAWHPDTFKLDLATMQGVPHARDLEPEEIPAAIDVERDRRIKTLFSFGGVAYQLDEKSISRITAMGAQAKFAKIGGAAAGDLAWDGSGADFGWIASDNSIVAMDAFTMSDFADAARLWVARHTFIARTLKDLDPLPVDFKNDVYWSL